MTHDNVTDIVERLREEANVNLDNGFGDMVPACNDVLAVLDDLATLRKQLENARSEADTMRGLLQAIVDGYPSLRPRPKFVAAIRALKGQPC